jgi:hypothetical protein
MIAFFVIAWFFRSLFENPDALFAALPQEPASHRSHPGASPA